MSKPKSKPRAITCKTCGGNGWRLFTDNQLQRCDGCEKFPSDLEAAVAFFARNKAHPLYYLHSITVSPSAITPPGRATRK